MGLKPTAGTKLRLLKPAKGRSESPPPAEIVGSPMGVWGHLPYSQGSVHKPLKIVTVGRQNAAWRWDGDKLVNTHVAEIFDHTGCTDCQDDSVHQKAH